MQTGLYDEPEAAPGGNEQPPRQEDTKPSTGLLPKEFFGGKEVKPGDECMGRVAAVHEDEVSVEYLGDEEDKEKEEPEKDDEQPEPEAAPAGGGMGGGGMGGGAYD